MSRIERVGWSRTIPSPPSSLLTREWLVGNGLGGYASGTVGGVCTRRHHGLLIASLPGHRGRTMMLNELGEELTLPDGSSVPLRPEQSGEELLDPPAASSLVDFRLETGLPVWRYDVRGFEVEKRLLMVHLANTVMVWYRLVRGSGVAALRLRPWVRFRSHHGRVDEPFSRLYSVLAVDGSYEIHEPGSEFPLRLLAQDSSASLVLEGGRFREVFHSVEAARGYDARGMLWSPGTLIAGLTPGKSVSLIASTQPWDELAGVTPEKALAAELRRRRRLIRSPGQAKRPAIRGELELAADAFVVQPGTRRVDQARAQAEGDQARTVVAGYPWFTDWGRDTMISLEGLTLVTKREEEARFVLRTFGRYVREGLIPNRFPEGHQEATYDTADASLWYFHAIDRYLAATGDRCTLRLLLPKLEDIITRHRQGTRFGIGVDPADGLLRQGEEGVALTWMDAKVGNWVVTPRRGKAVEVNALWYNALRLMERWGGEERSPEEGRRYGSLADRVWDSFNRRFWNAEVGDLFDVIDGEGGADPSLRPNQLLSISLPHPVLDPGRWKAVVEVCRQELLTPVGLRSLNRGHPDYQPRYDGDRRSRDAAYHQGTVWSWLSGPFVDAWLKVHADDLQGAWRAIEGFEGHLGEACLGSISEIFDAEPPYTPRGCVAQAWGVAEILRCWVRLSSMGPIPEEVLRGTAPHPSEVSAGPESLQLSQ